MHFLKSIKCLLIAPMVMGLLIMQLYMCYKQILH